MRGHHCRAAGSCKRGGGTVDVLPVFLFIIFVFFCYFSSIYSPFLSPPFENCTSLERILQCKSRWSEVQKYAAAQAPSQTLKMESFRQVRPKREGGAKLQGDEQRAWHPWSALEGAMMEGGSCVFVVTAVEVCRLARGRACTVRRKPGAAVQGLFYLPLHHLTSVHRRSIPTRRLPSNAVASIALSA